MASARSTVSMARTTPAQKPRGEQSTILKSGFGSGLADIGAFSGTESPLPPGGERPIRIRTWDWFRAESRHFSEGIAPFAPQGLYRAEFPSSLMTPVSPPKEVGEAQRR